MGNSIIEESLSQLLSSMELTCTFIIYLVEGPKSSDLLTRNMAHKLNPISRVDEISGVFFWFTRTGQVQPYENNTKERCETILFEHRSSCSISFAIQG